MPPITKEPCYLNVQPSDMIESVKSKIEKVFGISIANQRLIVSNVGTLLADGKMLSDYTLISGISFFDLLAIRVSIFPATAATTMAGSSGASAALSSTAATARASQIKGKKAGADLFAKDDDEDLDWLS